MQLIGLWHNWHQNQILHFGIISDPRYCRWVRTDMEGKLNIVQCEHRKNIYLGATGAQFLYFFVPESYNTVINWFSPGIFKKIIWYDTQVCFVHICPILIGGLCPSHLILHGSLYCLCRCLGSKFGHIYTRAV